MLKRLPRRLPFSLAPLLGEATRHARQRRLLITWLVAVIVAGVVGGVLASRSPGGHGPASGGGAVVTGVRASLRSSPQRRLAACGTAVRGASRGVGLVEANCLAFPVRTIVLTLRNEHRLTVGDVKVTENGGPVLDPTLIPASQASKRMFGVVLVLDTSFSVTGKPLAAEQAFAAQRNPNERLGAIDFNRKSRIVLPLTTSAARIASALAAIPPAHTGRHIYDAVADAEAMLTAAHVGSGTIIVLSDGVDTGSTKTLEQVVTAARRANARIDAVGLKDRVYKPGTLRALAAAGNGAYAQAKTQRLPPLFAQLSRQLSNEYVLRYTSVASPNKPVLVKVQVKGVGVARLHYRTPALPLTSARERP